MPSLPDSHSETLHHALKHHVTYTLGRDWNKADSRSMYLALAHTMRDHLIERRLQTEQRYIAGNVKRMYYLSIEYLIGRSLSNNLYNLGMYQGCARALQELGADLEEIEAQERDAALGNGGLGRLAACFLDSLATLNMPGFGYGIHYEYGLFRQTIQNGYQREQLDYWMGEAAPLQFVRPHEACLIPLYGRIEHGIDAAGNYNPMWLEWKVVIGVPCDIPIAGYGGQTVNYLRLYAARASTELDFEIFNMGDYVQAMEQKIASENISKILYPSDTVLAGRELRLVQEYFLVACALRDILGRYLQHHQTVAQFADKVAIQLNDTHPALAVAELMRLLVDEQDLEWEAAWRITTATCAYTNHTLLPEALEKWPVELLEKVLPRHLQLIYEINHRFLQEVAAMQPGDSELLQRISIIEETPVRQVRMAHLAIVGSHSVNGVSALHTQLLRTRVVADFNAIWPGRFNNKTNGISPRRWLLNANPELAGLITQTIGDGWISNLDALHELEAHASDGAFQDRFYRIKQRRKTDLARLVFDTTRTTVSPETLFDIQAKRIHEYKRQLLLTLYIIHEYLVLADDDRLPVTPRTFLFAGKAAPGYWKAKQIIKLIHNVAAVIGQDQRVRGWLRVAFIPDYRVTLAEQMIPAADLSEQISTAGTEASGTGNMKFMLNGALTIGTRDGANIEMEAAVGPENMYLFGKQAHDIQQLRQEGHYSPEELVRQQPALQRVLEALRQNRFCHSEPGLFQWLLDDFLVYGDHYFHLGDFAEYLETQARISQDYTCRKSWLRKTILNVARSGRFSSDRTIREYASEIWNIASVEKGRSEE